MEKYVEEIPTWALCYIINGDPSGLSDDDVALIDGFYERYEKQGLHICIVSPHDDEYGSFSAFPAFGLATDVIECDILCERIKTDTDDCRKD